jgi:hypothetical protein
MFLKLKVLLQVFYFESLKDIQSNMRILKGYSETDFWQYIQTWETLEMHIQGVTERFRQIFARVPHTKRIKNVHIECVCKYLISEL